MHEICWLRVKAWNRASVWQPLSTNLPTLQRARCYGCVWKTIIIKMQKKTYLNQSNFPFLSLLNFTLMAIEATNWACLVWLFLLRTHSLRCLGNCQCDSNDAAQKNWRAFASIDYPFETDPKAHTKIERSLLFNIEWKYDLTRYFIYSLTPSGSRDSA